VILHKCCSGFNALTKLQVGFISAQSERSEKSKKNHLYLYEILQFFLDFSLRSL
jgi:hypothetical protein